MGVRWMQRRGKLFACGLHFSLVYSLFFIMIYPQKRLRAIWPGCYATLATLAHVIGG